MACGEILALDIGGGVKKVQKKVLRGFKKGSEEVLKGFMVGLSFLKYS